MSRVEKLLSPAIEKIFGKASKYRVRYDPAYEAEREADKRAIKGRRRSPIASSEKRYLRVIECRKGRKISGLKANLFIHSNTHVGFIGVGTALRRQLLTVEGVISHQTGDEEFSVIFPTETLEKVSGIVSPYLKRRANPAPAETTPLISTSVGVSEVKFQ